MDEKILFRGAEALILKNGDEIIKRRVRKTYRIPEVDEKIRKISTKSETKLFGKAKDIINVPRIKKLDERKKEIFMDFIKGKKISESLDEFNEKKQIDIFLQIGNSVAKLHDADIIHGDLTTSNMIFSENDNKVYFIDFGLGFQSHKIEDKAVDIHLLKQALEAKHFKNWQKLLKSFFNGYENSKNYGKVKERYNKVERRGRYKENY